MRSRALGDVTPMTEDDLWEERSPKSRRSRLIAGEARRQQDRAVEIGLSNHNRVEKVIEKRPDVGGEMNVSYQAGLLRQAFEQQARRLHGARGDDRRQIEPRRRRLRRPCQADGGGDQGRACRRAGGSQSARTAGASPLGARPKSLDSKPNQLD